MSAQSRPENETTLSAFVSAATPEPEPDPADDYDGLQAVAASVSAGFTTTQAREDRSDDRVVADSQTCAGCNAHYTGDGLCEECAGTGDLVDAGTRSPGGGR